MPPKKQKDNQISELNHNMSISNKWNICTQCGMVAIK